MTIAALLCAGSPSAAQTIVFSLAQDWSNVNNPNGAWQLNKAPGQAFTLNQADYWSDGSGQRAWVDQPYPQLAHVPVWMKLTNSFGTFASAGTVIMHTAETGRTGTDFSSVTWTSPGSGTAVVSGGAWVQKDFNRPQRWELFLNGVSLSFGNLSQSDAFAQANPFNFASGSGGASILTMNVQQNDVIQLLIYRQSAGTPGTFVGLNLSTSFTPVPEPSTVALLFLGLAGGCLLRRRAWRRGNP